MYGANMKFKCEFAESPLWVSHILLEGENEIFSIFSTFFMQFGKHVLQGVLV